MVHVCVVSYRIERDYRMCNVSQFLWPYISSGALKMFVYLHISITLHRPHLQRSLAHSCIFQDIVYMEHTHTNTRNYVSGFRWVSYIKYIAPRHYHWYETTISWQPYVALLSPRHSFPTCDDPVFHRDILHRIFYSFVSATWTIMP